jgi:hypothetical protein
VTWVRLDGTGPQAGGICPGAGGLTALVPSTHTGDTLDRRAAAPRPRAEGRAHYSPPTGRPKGLSPGTATRTLAGPDVSGQQGRPPADGSFQPGHRRHRDHERRSAFSPSASRRWRSCSTMKALCRSSASTNSSVVMMPFSTSRSRNASTAAVEATMPPSAGSSGSSADMVDSLPPPTVVAVHVFEGRPRYVSATWGATADGIGTAGIMTRR